MRRVLTAAATAALMATGALVAVPTAQAATQTVAVNCLTSSAADFTVSPGDVIVFQLNSNCAPLISSIPGSLPFQTIVNRMAIITTGGSAVAGGSSPNYTVTYTAGPNSGTDSLDISQAAMTRSLWRGTFMYGSNDYSMTIPGSDAPAPWLQAYGRSADTACATGWSPSWAEWPNGGTGGFVCVRSFVYNNSTGAWDTRRLLKQQEILASLR